MIVSVKVGVVLLVVAAGAVALGETLVGVSSINPRIIRSRLTITVQTPEGERSGSSVTQLTTYFPEGLTRAQGWGQTEELVGEAVAVDLGPLGVLFSTFERPSVLARSGGDAYDPALREFPPEKFAGGHLQNASDSEINAAGLDGLNKLKPRGSLLPQDLPVLVCFGDLNDPTSVTLVDPIDLSKNFGPGVTLKGATIEITDDPMTRGIETRLPWLMSSNFAQYLFVNPTHQPPPDFRVERHLTYDDFRRLPR
jgi:hypothetical protein